MLQESLFYKFIYSLAAFLANGWNNSLCAAFFRKLGRALKTLLAGSWLADLVWREGCVSRTWENSLLYRLPNGLIGLPSRLLHKPYLNASEVLTGSILFRLLLLFLDRLHVLTAVFLAAALVVPDQYWHNQYSLMVFSGLLFLYILRTIAEGNTGFSFKALNVFLPVFLVCVVIAVPFSIMPAESSRFLGFHLTGFLALIMMIASIRNRTEMSETVGIITAGLALSGLYGVYQYVAGVPVNPAWIDPSTNEGSLRRAWSAFGNPNNFAEVLIMLLPFGAAAFFNAKGWFKKLFFLAAAIPPFIALLMTLSRSGWIGFAAAALIFMFFKDKRLIPVFILLGILVFPFLPQSIYRRILSIVNPEDTSTLTRVNIYRSVLPILKEYWFSGLGLGSETLVKVMRNFYMFTKGGTILPHSHNLYLQIWFETGIAGILSFLAFIGATFKKGIRTIYSSGDKYIKNILIAGVSSLSGILVMGLAEYVWFYPRVQLFFWVAAGLLFAALGMALREGKDDAAGAQDKPGELV